MHVNIDRIFTTVARNLDLQDFGKYTQNWVEWSYEAEKLIGSRHTFLQEEATYTSTGNKATGTITFTDNPVSGDSITLNGVELFFKNSTDLGEAKSPNEIEIGIGLARTLNNSSAQYGLIQSLTGLENISLETGTYINAAVFHYPETLNTSNYSLNFNKDSEILTNGDFTGGYTGWNLDTNITYGTNNIDFSNTTQYKKLNKAITGSDFVVGDSYEVSFTVSGYYTGTIGGNLYNDVGEGFIIPPVSSNGTHTSQHVVGEVSSTTSSYYNRLWLQVTSTTDFTGVIDDVSLKKISSAELVITAKEIGLNGNNYSLESDNANAKISSMSLTEGKGIYRNQQIVLPENNVKLLGVRVGSGATNSNHAELRATAATHRGRVGKNESGTQQRAFRYYVNGNRLNIQHDNLDEITIVYLAYPLDMRGYPMIKEGHETAVAQYIMWQMKLIEFYNGKLPQYITKELEKRWYFLCGKARGDDSMPTSEELKQIGNMWNTLIPVKSSNGLINF